MFAAWTSAHKRSLLLLLLLPVVAGIAVGFSLPVTLFPDIVFPRVRLIIDAGDRPAEQMLLQVTAPIEEAVHSVPGVVNVRSTTTRGTAEINVSFEWGTDMIAATLQINAAAQQLLPRLPPGTTLSAKRMDPTVFPIISYSLTSDHVSLTTMRDLALYQLRPLLTGISGVATIGVSGGSDEEFHVIVDPNRLIASGVSIDDVVKAVGANNVLQAVGRIEDHYKLYLAVSDDTITGLDELKKVAVRTTTGGIVTVGDVATLRRATAPLWTRVTADGKDAILVSIYQQPGGNSVQIANSVKAKLAEVSPKLPPGVKIANWYDQSELVIASAVSVRDAILIGAALAALVLLAFLRSFKIMVIASLVVPAALASTTLLLSIFGMSFNIMTLGGMAAAVGLIVDDAIVMVEHIVRRLASDPVHEAAATVDRKVLQAAAEFARPLTGSSAATLIVFLPLAFLSGVTGAFFKALSITMASGLIFSFLLTWLAVPLAAQWLLTEKNAKHDAAGPFTRWLLVRYETVASGLLKYPAIVLIAATVPILGVGYVAFNAVGSGFMPSIDEGGFIVDYHADPGTALSETDRLLGQVEAILKSMPEVQTWSRRTGAGLGGDITEANVGDFFVRLKPGDRRPIDEIMSELRAKIIQTVPGLNVEMAQLMEDLIGDLTAVPQPIEIKLFGDDSPTLITTASKVAAELAKLKGVVDVRNGINPAGNALNIKVDRLKAAVEGIDPAEVTRLLGIALGGQVVAQIPTSLKQIGVRVWSPEVFRKTDTDVANFPIRAPDGHIFQLKRVATVEAVDGLPQITRETLQRMVAPTARLEGLDLGSAASAVRSMLDQPGFLPNNVRYELGGLYQQQQLAFQGLLKVFAAATALVFVLLLFIYERFSVAFAILLMPLLATCAVFVGLWLTGVELNITAMMGMTMIIGIVTEVAIFYFTEFDDLLRSGRSVRVALIEAGQNRFRPIAMTTLAAILTLLPLAFAIGQGSAMQQPLAIAIISGLIVQLPLVLLVMPSVYLVLERGDRV
jgi:CzcA family heavy metal efflux pump